MITFVDSGNPIEPWPSNATIHNCFERLVDLHPTRVALQFKDQYYTFIDLERLANRLSQTIRKNFVDDRNLLVAVCIDRSPEMLIALLAVLKAGGAYVPIDPKYPADRINFILKDTAAQVFIFDTRPPIGIQFLGLLLDIESDSAYSSIDSRPSIRFSGSRLAYIMYTSGSSGNPKGVMCEHFGVVNNLTWMIRFLDIDASDVILQKTNFTFDVSIWELFVPLFVGCKQVILPPGDERIPEKILSAIVTHKITLVHFVPTMLAAFIPEIGNHSLESLRYCLSSGEPLTTDICRSFARVTDKRIPLVNLYGPTEATIHATAWLVNPDAEAVLIGKPVDNTKVYLISDSKRIIKAGVIGELCIGGCQVAQGYLNRSDLTGKVFLQDIYSPNPKQRMYKTGDLARFTVNGDLEYIGRIDRQLKINGYRIEPAEIEFALRGIPGISNAVVIGSEQRSGNKILEAFWTGTAKERHIRSELAKTLPHYMLPSRFTQLQQFLVTPTGKIDRAALSRLEPSKDIKETLRYSAKAQFFKLFETALDNRSIGINEYFFDIGGTSITAIKLVSDINTRFNTSISITELVIKTPFEIYDTHIAAQTNQANSSWLKGVINRILALFHSNLSK